MANPTVRLSLRIPPTLHDKLEEFASTSGLAKNSVCALALLKYFQANECTPDDAATKAMLETMAEQL